MPPASFIAGLVVLLAVSAHANFDLYCPETVLRCSGKSSVEAFQYGVGDCEVSSKSLCEVLAASYTCIDIATQFINDPLCRSAYVADDAYCSATAFASACGNAYAKAQCNGEKAHGCATAEADAYVFACSIAASIVELSVALGQYTAECNAWVGVAVKAMTTAAVEASADVCASGDGEFADELDTQFYRNVFQPIAIAYATCFVYCDDDGVFTSAEGFAYGTDDYYGFG